MPTSFKVESSPVLEIPSELRSCQILTWSNNSSWLLIRSSSLESFETISLNSDSDSEINNLDSLGSSDINYDKQPVFEDLNNQLLASLYEEPTLNTQDEVKIPI